MRRISLLRRRRYHPSFIRRRTAKRKRKNRHYGRPFSNPSHEARSGFPKTCPCNLQRNADFKCFLRRNNLADLSLTIQPTLNHTQQSASRGDVSHRIKIERCSKLQTICRLVHLCEQFPPSIVKTPGRNVCISAVPRTASLRQSNFPDILSPSEFNGIPSACIAPRLKCVLFSMNLLHIHL